MELNWDIMQVTDTKATKNVQNKKPRIETISMKPTHCRRHSLPFRWPTPPFQIALVEPEIPPNTGNIARLCAATGTPLHLIGRLGFRLNDAALKRAGLDYWPAVELHRHRDVETFLPTLGSQRFFLLSTRGAIAYTSVAYAPGDVFVFGCESKGLPEALLDAWPGRVLGIPMQVDCVRSLNLATAAALQLYEALRQAQGW